MTGRMSELAHHTLQLALDQLSEYNEGREAEIIANEDKLDIYEDRLGTYLVQISQHGVSMDDIRTVSRLLHAISDFERIGDHALNLQESAQELHEKALHFSGGAEKELRVLLEALMETVDKSFSSFRADSARAAMEVEPLEETIDRLTEEVRSRHVARLQSGECTIQMGFILNDLLVNIERISDHCSNVAVSVIEERRDHVAPHAYISEMKGGGDFNARVTANLERYRLPERSVPGGEA